MWSYVILPPGPTVNNFKACVVDLFLNNQKKFYFELFNKLLGQSPDSKWNRSSVGSENGNVQSGHFTGVEGGGWSKVETLKSGNGFVCFGGLLVISETEIHSMLFFTLMI